MKLSDHFTLEEMTRSATASARNINNALHPAHPHDAAVIANLKHLCEEVLEPLRRHVGGPILISSGYRCPALNTAVGGATGSQHMTGEAADIYINSIEEGKRWVTWIMEHCTFDQLLWERATPTSCHFWIHVSCRQNHSANRQQVRSIVKHE